MVDELLRRFKARMEEELDTLETHILLGRCSSMEDYKEHVGERRGWVHAYELVKNLVAELQGEDEADEE